MSVPWQQPPQPTQPWARAGWRPRGAAARADAGGATGAPPSPPPPPGARGGAARGGAGGAGGGGPGGPRRAPPPRGGPPRARGRGARGLEEPVAGEEVDPAPDLLGRGTDRRDERALRDGAVREGPHDLDGEGVDGDPHAPDRVLDDDAAADSFRAEVIPHRRDRRKGWRRHMGSSGWPARCAGENRRAAPPRTPHSLTGADACGKAWGTGPRREPGRTR